MNKDDKAFHEDDDKNQMENTTLYKPQEAARQLNITRAYLSQLVREEKATASGKTDGGQRLYSMKDIENAKIYLDSIKQGVVLQKAKTPEEIANEDWEAWERSNASKEATALKEKETDKAVETAPEEKKTLSELFKENKRLRNIMIFSLAVSIVIVSILMSFLLTTSPEGVPVLKYALIDIIHFGIVIFAGFSFLGIILAFWVFHSQELILIFGGFLLFSMVGLFVTDANLEPSMLSKEMNLQGSQSAILLKENNYKRVHLFDEENKKMNHSVGFFYVEAGEERTDKWRVEFIEEDLSKIKNECKSNWQEKSDPSMRKISGFSACKLSDGNIALRVS